MERDHVTVLQKISRRVSFREFFFFHSPGGCARVLISVTRTKEYGVYHPCVVDHPVDNTPIFGIIRAPSVVYWGT